MVGGYKNEDGRWNTSGHMDRIVRVDTDALATFAKLYDEPGTPPLRPRLPALHAGTLGSVLTKLANRPKRLLDLRNEYTTSEMWNETTQQKDGTISRRPDSDARFPATPRGLVLSGPHFFVATPFNKTPRKNCNSNKAYDVLNLEMLPDDYLPHTNYQPSARDEEYLRRTPLVGWHDPGYGVGPPITDFFRLIVRKMIPPSGERTLTPSIIPPGMAHIDGAFSVAFRSNAALISVVAAWSSILFDYVTKITGK